MWSNIDIFVQYYITLDGIGFITERP